MFDDSDETGCARHGPGCIRHAFHLDDPEQARAELLAAVRAYLNSDFDGLDVMVRHATYDFVALNIIMMSAVALYTAGTANPDAPMEELKLLAEDQIKMLIEVAKTSEADHPGGTSTQD